MNYFRENNFDAIRLVAASQVMVVHGMEHLHVSMPALRSVITAFPGVPAFFFISGFLISASWERNPNLRIFASNRALRIFPALWATVSATVISLFVFYDRDILIEHAGQFAAWTLFQASILQVWTPDFLRSYGVGAVNGSLWTISVELTFYALTPLIYWLFTLRKPEQDEKPSQGSVLTVLGLITLTSWGVQIGLELWESEGRFALVEKLLNASFLPWIGMFTIGIWAQKSIERIYPWVAGRAHWYILAFAALAVLSHYAEAYPFLRSRSNNMGIINYALMCFLILSLAYSGRGLSDLILRRNDISYGVYIIHMPIVGALVHTGHKGWGAVAAACLLTLLTASASWRWVEKPALRLKPKTLYSHDAS